MHETLKQPPEARNLPPTAAVAQSQTPARSPGGRGLLLVVGVAIVAVCGYLLHADYLREVGYKRAAVAEQARAILNAVAAGINAHVRRGSEVMDNRLDAFMRELVDGTVAEAVRIQVSGGEIIAEAGEVERIGAADQWAHPDAEEWPDGDRMTFTQEVATLGGRDFGAHHAPMRMGVHWSTLPAGPYDVLIIIDVHEMREQTRAALWRTLWLGLAVGLVLLMAVNGFMAMLRRRHLEAQLAVTQERGAHQAKLAQLSAGLAHETKNPLGVVRGLAQSIAGEPDASRDARQMAHRIVDEVDRTVGQLNSFLTFARPLEPELEPVALDELVEGLLPLFEAETEGGVGFSYTPCGFEVQADRGMLRRMLLNLVINAVKACEGGGQVSITTTPQGSALTLAIVDTGMGIAPKDLERVQEPYFTRFSGGTGLGLAIVHGIADAHGWRVAIASQLGKGTTVSLAGLLRVE